jgi:phage gp46-like protein
VNNAQLYGNEALQWLVADGIARSVKVVAEIVRMGVLGLIVTVARMVGAPTEYRFEYFWANLPNAV